VEHPERSHPNVTLTVLSVAGLSFALLSSAVVPALPTIQHSLHTSENGVAWILTAYLLSASVGTAILGRLGDMYGKERVLVWTMVVLAAGVLLAGLASSLSLLIVARAIQGAGGGVFPLAFGIIRDEFPREKVAGSIGLMSAILGIGGGIGIVVGALIVQYLSWHWLFWLPFIVVVLATIGIWRFVPESPVRVPGRINWTAAALMSGGMTAVLIAVSETTVWGWGGTKTIVLLAGGGLLCVAWVLVELRSSEPLIDMGLMRVRAVWTANVTAFLLGAGMYA
jgi:MFS family permease